MMTKVLAFAPSEVKRVKELRAQLGMLLSVVDDPGLDDEPKRQMASVVSAKSEALSKALLIFSKGEMK